MKRVFADTLYWVAVTRPADPWKHPAKLARQTLGETILVTTDEVLAEFLTLLASGGEHLRRQAVKIVRAILQNPNVKVLPQSRDSFLRGVDLYERRLDKEYSLTDCISMSSMHSRVGSPKSGKARTVDVPQATVEVLKGWIDTIRAEAAVRGGEATWLFPGATGQPTDEALIRAAFRRCLKAAGIQRRLRLHDLRHSYASLALQRGVPLLVVSRQLGHASIAITADVYGHLTPTATRAAADAFQAILTAPGRNRDATPASDAA